jgi:hypothetical protein
MRRLQAVIYFCAAGLLVLCTSVAAPSCSKTPSTQHKQASHAGVSYGAIMASDPEQVDRMLGEEDDSGN